MRVVSSSIWNSTSSISSVRCSDDSPPRWSAWASRSRLVRSEVSGVRSSWPASPTSWRCRSREADSAVSMALKDVARRAISSLPSTRIGRELLGAGDLLGGVAEQPHRAQPVAGHRPAGQRGGDHPDHAAEEEQAAQLPQRVLGGCQRLGEDERGPGFESGNGAHPVGPVRRHHGPGRLFLRPSGDVPLTLAELDGSHGIGQRIEVWGIQGVALRREDGNPDVGRPEHPVGELSVEDVSRLDLRQTSGSFVQGVVERRHQLVLHADVGDRGDQRHREAHRDGCQEGHPGGERPAEAHQPSRST